MCPLLLNDIILITVVAMRALPQISVFFDYC